MKRNLVTHNWNSIVNKQIICYIDSVLKNEFGLLDSFSQEWFVAIFEFKKKSRKERVINFLSKDILEKIL